MAVGRAQQALLAIGTMAAMSSGPACDKNGIPLAIQGAPHEGGDRGALVVGNNVDEGRGEVREMVRSGLIATAVGDVDPDGAYNLFLTGADLSILAKKLDENDENGDQAVEAVVEFVKGGVSHTVALSDFQGTWANVKTPAGTAGNADGTSLQLATATWVDGAFTVRENVGTERPVPQPPGQPQTAAAQ